MSSPTIIDDPEKGTSEQLEATLPVLSPKDDKETVTVAVSAVAPAVIIPPKKSQQKISRWVKFKLWFNTYR